ncbi:hypothetical protein [Mycolicibacterium hippocampi]|uniref:Uncharacterized protein n=1 Tax=Mycolicibacterium hippocampi TaxID=659824 RepID=A0A7I9ZPJ7_9MYCO|nr:hypothetical protein [Mycolicibacterium hippocampi]GFH02779.1 hypothetical protein MHIP_32620 [Mycolicibacterium hippocampi]
MTMKAVLATTALLAASILGAGVAHADYIDFGTNQVACKAAARQANASGYGYSYCYETGPGHYSLYLAD